MSCLFIELLQISIGNRDCLSRLPSPSEWSSLFQEAQKQAVVALLSEGLERLPEEQHPPKALLLQWICLRQLTENTYYLQRTRAKELTLLFAEKGCESSVLKGVGFSQLYPVPEHRQVGDIDLWVNDDRKKIMSWIKDMYSVDLVVWHHVDAKIFDDVSTEIHFHPGWLYNPTHNRNLQRWFNKQKDDQFEVNEKLGFAYPTVRFNAIFSLIHFYHHLIEEGVGIRHIVDYYYILKLLSLDERLAVMADLESLGMNKVTGAMMWVLQEVCGLSSEYILCNPDEKEGKFVLDEVMYGGNFGQYRKDSRRRNTVSRLFSMLLHYPKEVLWVVPWKLWHKCWRLKNARI